MGGLQHCLSGKWLFGRILSVHLCVIALYVIVDTCFIPRAQVTVVMGHTAGETLML